MNEGQRLSANLVTPLWLETGFLSSEKRADLWNWTLGNESHFSPSPLRPGVVDPTVRRSLSFNNLGSLTQVFEQHLCSSLEAWAKALQMPAFEVSAVELELASYGDGDKYVFHTDTFSARRDDKRGERVLSAMYCFYQPPPPFTGGELRIHRLGPKSENPDYNDITIEDNSIAVWPSWAPHEVRPVVCGSRRFADSLFAVHCWLYRAR